jgi:hypothetical protein
MDVEDNVGVVPSLIEHVQSMEVERQYNGLTTYDPVGTASLHQYFDALINAPNGVYDGRPFFTESKSVPSLSEFVGWLIRMHDNDTKLLYMVQMYTEPQYFDFNCPPHLYLVRYAILKNNR